MCIAIGNLEVLVEAPACRQVFNGLPEAHLPMHTFCIRALSARSQEWFLPDLAPPDPAEKGRAARLLVWDIDPSAVPRAKASIPGRRNTQRVQLRLPNSGPVAAEVPVAQVVAEYEHDVRNHRFCSP